MPDVIVPYQQIPHHVQQIMSGESTPILCSTIPSFEMFMTSWEDLLERHLNLAKYIEPGLEWASKYYGCMDRTQAYIITMCKLFCFSALDN